MTDPAAVPDEPELLVDVADGVAVLTLNRPAKLNAVTGSLGNAYVEALERADDDPAVRAVVVTGAGRGFCAGADLGNLARISRQEHEPTFPPDGRSFPPVIRKPLVAAVNGPCAGLGVVLALGADLRFASRTATFTTAFARLGLVAEYGLSWMLPRLVGPGHALDLLMSGRIVDAEEAARMGLVERLVDDALAAALDYARLLATTTSPRSMATVKAQVLRDLEGDRDRSVAEAGALMRESFGWPDLPEGLAAFTEKRAPRFPPLPPRG
ncbi:MAG: enoyl-CoA hydratase-related protein [Motilibacteraceae bacterium]